MILKVTRGEDFAFIDNEGEVLHQVKVSGNNDAINKSLDNILNVQTAIRFDGELGTIPNELVIREGSKPSEINKASDLYIKDYFIDLLKLQGFNVDIIKE